MVRAVVAAVAVPTRDPAVGREAPVVGRAEDSAADRERALVVPVAAEVDVEVKMVLLVVTRGPGGRVAVAQAETDKATMADVRAISALGGDAAATRVPEADAAAASLVLAVAVAASAAVRAVVLVPAAVDEAAQVAVMGWDVAGGLQSEPVAMAAGSDSEPEVKARIERSSYCRLMSVRRNKHLWRAWSKAHS